MEDFKPSPFDRLISDFEQLLVKQAMITVESSDPSYRILTPLEQSIYQQVRLLRVVYINYSLLECRESGKNGIMTNEEMACIFDERIKVTLDYYSFINQLNHLGRELKDRFSIEIPNYTEIRFFRNKVMEHWGDYLDVQLSSGAHGTADKLPIPIMLCKNIAFEAHERAKASLIEECVRLDPDFSLEGIHSQDPRYAKSIFSILRKVDPELTSQHKTDLLIELLFAYEFPLPIYNIEDYCAGLVLLLQGQKLTV